MAAKVVSRNNNLRTQFEEPVEDDEECDDDKWLDEYTHRFEALIDERDKAQDAYYTQLSSVEHQGEPEEIWEGNMVQELKHNIVELNDGRHDTFLEKLEPLIHETYLNILRETPDTKEPRDTKESRVQHPDEQRIIPSLSKIIAAVKDDSKEPSVQHPEQQIEMQSFNRKNEDLTDNSKMGCVHCSKAIRVEDMTSLQSGQHIAMPGKRLSYYVKGKRMSAYQHHAIVKKIVESSRDTATLTLIHFYEDEKDKVIKVLEQTVDYNLQEKELYIIEYKHPKYDPDTIVKRAEDVLMKSDKGSLFKYYNIFTKNCEHFATWCVIGKDESLQINTIGNIIKKTFWNVMGGCNTVIARLLLKIGINYSDEIASAVTVATDTSVLGVSFAFHILYCAIKTVVLIKRHKKEKTICRHCLKERLWDLWLQSGVFGVTSLISFVIIHFALPVLSAGVTIPITVALILVGTALTLAVPRIRKALWSPVKYCTKEIKTLSEINVGDIVSLTYYGLAHLVVVSEVHTDPNPDKGEIQGIHYSLSKPLDTRIIAEETFPIELKKSKVNLVDFGLTSTHSPQEVVDRVRKRIGEQKWKMSCNRSDNVCFWAVDKSDYNFEKGLKNSNNKSKRSKSLSSLLLGKADVHLMNEIQPGDVVKYKSYKGIIVKLEDIKDGREFCMHVVVHKGLFNPLVEKVELIINLNKDYLTVYKYHPVHCVSKSVRVEKAMVMIGKPSNRLTRTGFIQDIIFKVNDINVGDVISLPYRGFSHIVVVSDVHMDSNPVKCTIKGIHYSLPKAFGTRIIAEETFQIELEALNVNLVDFNSACIYSPLEVVDRARKRIGEQKWNIFFNTSEHFCRWAKERVDYISEDNPSHSGKQSSPLVGKEEVHLMNEIQPGDAVKYQSYKGIIVKLEDIKDEREFSMHLVVRKSCFDYCGAEVEHIVDLNKDHLKVYRYNQVYCISMSERVEKAMSMKGKRIQRWTRTGFIEDIILKKSHNNFII